jgi:hypothetical protein
VVSFGIAGGNILLENDAASQFTQEFLEARLSAELRSGSSPKVSESDIAHDWDLLQKSRNRLEVEASMGSIRTLSSGSSRSERAGNRP